MAKPLFMIEGGAFMWCSDRFHVGVSRLLMDAPMLCVYWN